MKGKNFNKIIEKLVEMAPENKINDVMENAVNIHNDPNFKIGVNEIEKTTKTI